MWQRFSELERAEPVVEEAVARLIAHARRHDPQIGRVVHIDSTEAETHVRLIHDCQPSDHCPHQDANRIPGVQRLTTSQAAALRAQQLDAETPDQAPRAPPVLESDGRERIRLGAHYYRTRDPDVGIRAYDTRDGRRSRVWLGQYHQTAVDHRTGGRLATRAQPANKNEADIYPDMLTHLTGI